MRILIIFFLSAIFSSSTSFSQKNTQTQIIQELIAIQTLITENRIAELSDFLDEYSYLAADDGESFIRFKMDESEYTVIFNIQSDNDKKYLRTIITTKGGDGNYIFNPTKNQYRTWIRDVFFSESTTITEGVSKYPWFVFKTFKEDVKNGEVNGLDNDSLQFVDEGRYKYSFVNTIKGERETVAASNVTNMFSDDDFIRLSFFGPGKLTYINFIFPKDNDAKFSDEVAPFFYVIPEILEDDSKKENINIDFFMSLNKIDDIIWADIL